MKQQTKEILARVIELQAELDVRKALYDELDMLTMQLQDEGFKSAELNGCLLTMINNFEKSNVAYRPAGVKLWEIKVKRIKGGA